jgi:hypothetical protein
MVQILLCAGRFYRGFCETFGSVGPHVSWRANMAETTAVMQCIPKCREHQVLQGRLRADTKVYVVVTRRLESCKSEDFEQTYQAAASARLAFLKAREALKVHIAVHKCER